MFTDTVTIWSPAVKLSNETTQVPSTKSAVAGMPSIVTNTELAFTSSGNVKVTLISPSTENSPVTSGVMVKSAFNTLNVSTSNESVWFSSPAL